MKNLKNIAIKSFENLKHKTAEGSEYWSARELQPVLGHHKWRSFSSTINKAIHACHQSGHQANQHYVKVYNTHDRKLDYHLTRFACYLLLQNNDPRNQEIAYAQKYFGVQTRCQEISDSLAADIERIFVRKQTSKLFKALSGIAKNSGIHDKLFRTFHDAGYRGLYGGLSSDEIKALKNIPKDHVLLDCMGTTELAANQFRMTQARDKLARENVHNPLHAILLHQLVGQEVRQAIRRIGGKMPENLMAAEHIKCVERRIKNADKKIKLSEKTLKV